MILPNGENPESFDEYKGPWIWGHLISLPKNSEQNEAEFKKGERNCSGVVTQSGYMLGKLYVSPAGTLWVVINDGIDFYELWEIDRFEYAEENDHE